MGNIFNRVATATLRRCGRNATYRGSCSGSISTRAVVERAGGDVYLESQMGEARYRADLSRTEVPNPRRGDTLTLGQAQGPDLPAGTVLELVEEFQELSDSWVTTWGLTKK